MSRWLRPAVLLTLAVAALVALLWHNRAETAAPAAHERLAWVATAHQHGVVGYRDPIGVISPDGRELAYSEGRHLRVVPVAGGAPVTLASLDGQIRQVTWMDDARLAVEQTGSGDRWLVVARDGEREPDPLWGGRVPGASVRAGPNTVAKFRVLHPPVLRQLAWSPDRLSVAAIVATDDGPQLWHLPADPTREGDIVPVTGRPSFPAWRNSETVACLVTADGRTRVSLPCGRELLVPIPDVEMIGPIAFSPDGATLYFASPSDRGVVDLWSMTVANRRVKRLTGFGRDTYAPSVAADGTVLFKIQSYRTFIADIAGAAVRQLTTFQSETPSWHPTLPLVAVTYGTWRRVLDDAKYPDIAQEIGIVDANAPHPSEAPRDIVAQSDSEDQAMAWSPNGKWIALHSHREMSDDVWLRPADGSQPDRRITFLGRGAEVGWPRWSPDGTTVLLDGASPKTGRSALFVVGVDQESGAVTSDVREVETAGFAGEITHGEWMPDNRTVVAVAKVAPGRHAIVSVDRAGGTPRVIHEVETEHDFPGLAVSADGRTIAFVAPASDGFFQIFQIPSAGGAPRQVTRDPVHKTQPAFSPAGDRLAYTVWSYDAQFWTLAR